MTGDGVNDAPGSQVGAYRHCHGGKGNRCCPGIVGALVLLDDDFSSIVGAVRLGRRIFDNIKKAMAYIFAVHVPIAGMSFIPVVMQWPLVLLPVHIVFLELIIDPACSIVFEAETEETNVMNRPPRDPKEPLFGKRTIVLSVLQGLMVLAIILGIYITSRAMGRGVEEARALTFTTLIFSNLGLIFTNRSWTRTIWETLRSPNTALWWVLGGAFGFLALVLFVPFLRDLFRFSKLHPTDLFICLAGGILSIIWFEILKYIRERRNRVTI